MTVLCVYMPSPKMTLYLPNRSSHELSAKQSYQYIIRTCSMYLYMYDEQEDFKYVIILLQSHLSAHHLLTVTISWNINHDQLQYLRGDDSTFLALNLPSRLLPHVALVPAMYSCRAVTATTTRRKQVVNVDRFYCNLGRMLLLKNKPHRFRLSSTFSPNFLQYLSGKRPT